MEHVGTPATIGRSARRHVAASWVVVALVALAACGSGDEGAVGEPTTTTERPAPRELSKEDFVAAANEVCSEMNSKYNISLTRYPNGPETIDEIVLVLARAGDVVEDALEDLRAIGRPEADDDHITGMYSKLDNLITLTGDMAAAAYRQDVATLEDLERRSDELSAQLSAEFAAYGLTACAE